MNSEIEKKWFVYIGDHHEGPFDSKEIFEKKSKGIINDESHVWCEGMPDWVVLSKVSDLNFELQKHNETPIEKTVIKKTKTSTKKINLPKLATLSILSLFFASFATLVLISRYAPEELHNKVRPALLKITESLPFTRPLFSLVPHFSDVKPEELKQLELARSGNSEIAPKLAIALSTNDANRPAFYLSTNLPDRTKFDLLLVGNSDTLLNRLQFSSQLTVATSKGLGKSEIFMAEAGQLVPKGEYTLYVTESNDQEEVVRNTLNSIPQLHDGTKIIPGLAVGSHILISKIYFIGGERDETYLTRLKSFHEKVKQNSERESLELRQYADTLNLQFNTLTLNFQKIYVSKKSSATLINNWKKSADTWQQINTQLDQTIQTWSKETLQNEFYFGKVYELVKSAYESMKVLFQIENSYLNQNQEKNAFEIQHGKALSEARESLELLKTKVAAMMNAPKSPSGLPTREGL